MEQKVVLDYSLVPLGMAMMAAYHIWLLYRVLKRPTCTVIGLNAINRRSWVLYMMEDVQKNGVLAVQTLRNNIMASTLLASTAIMLSSLIAVLMTGNGGREGSALTIVYGDRSELGVSIKFFSMLVCFLVAFLLSVQSIRYYSHASILINVPLKRKENSCKFSSHQRRRPYRHLTADCVVECVNRGSYFWSLGLRAFYFSFPLFFWIFGPIPMFLCCFVLVCVLSFLDAAICEFGWTVASIPDDDHDHCDGADRTLHQEEDDVELGINSINHNQP